MIGIGIGIGLKVSAAIYNRTYISKTENITGGDGSYSSPVKSISEALTLSAEKTGREKFIFKDSVEYNERLNTSKDKVYIDLNGSTLNAFNEISPGDWVLESGNVYKKTGFTHSNGETLNYDYIIVVAKPDGASFYSLLTRQTSIANCESNPGSYYVAGLGTGTATIYLHTAASADPSGESITYSATSRTNCIQSQDNVYVRDGVLLGGVDGYGPLNLGLNATVRDCLLSLGGTHQVVIKSGLIENCSFLYKTVVGGVAATFYDTTPDGYTAKIKNCAFINAGTAIYAHGSTNGSKFDILTYEKLFRYSTDITIIFMSASYNSNLIITGGFSDGGGKFMAAESENCTINRLLIKNTIGGDFGFQVQSITGALTMQNSVVKMKDKNVSDQLHIMNIDAGNTTSFYNNVFWLSGDVSSIRGVSAQRAGCTTTINYCIFIADNATNNSIFMIDDNVAGNITSDYNIYILKQGAPAWRRNGVGDSTSLSAWFSVTGKDDNSVYVTAGQEANFWLGDPASGDFRINPSAQVTDRLGNVLVGVFKDGTPITNAGVQSRDNYNAKTVESGSPTAWPLIPTSYSDAVDFANDNWAF